MNFKVLLTVCLFVASLFFLAIQDADAARFGGGRSFGSRPSMQRSTTAPMQQRPPMANAAPTQSAQRPGMFGGMGGMLGGLLAGSLLGSLLFGGPFTGGGMLDILLIAVIAFFAFKLFARSRTSRGASAAGAGCGGMQYQAPQEPQQPYGASSGGSAWDNLRDTPQGASITNPAAAVPAGFDTEEFLRGAKTLFSRLQSSWDERNLDDIALFTTPAVMQEIRQQCEADPTPSHAEVLLINAQLLSVKQESNGQEGDGQTASVFFDVLMREQAGRDTNQVREVWHFIRSSATGDHWKLDGIQQVE